MRAPRFSKNFLSWDDNFSMFNFSGIYRYVVLPILGKTTDWHWPCLNRRLYGVCSRKFDAWRDSSLFDEA